MAFGTINVDRSNVIVPTTGPIAAVSGTPDGKDDGQEFKVIVYSVDGTWEDFYVASSRPTVDRFFYASGPNWFPVDYVGLDAGAFTSKTAGKITAGMLGAISGSTSAKELSLKVVSSAAGTSRIAFGLTGVDTATGTVTGNTYGNTLDYALSRGGTDATLIIGGARYPIEFTSPRAWKISLESLGTTGKYANGIDNYMLTATVVTQAGVPVVGQTVYFSIISGTGASLSATSGTTNAAGRAVVFLYSTRQGDVTVRARTSVMAGGTSFADVKDINFKSTGIISIKAESADDQKLARIEGNAWFRISAYDVSGSRVDFTQLGINPADYGNVTSPESGADRYIGDSTSTIEPKVLVLKADVVKKPAGAALGTANIFYSVHKNSGNLQINIPFSALNRDGEYEIKVYLVNGSTVSYKFNVKDQGDVVKLSLDYGSTSFAAGTYLNEPTVTTEDVDGYKVFKGFKAYNEGAGNAAISISDAAYLDGKIAADGSFKLMDGKSGSIYMTLVDKTLNLTARQDLEIRKPASFLKLTAPTVTTVGGEATVDIELVDIDGNLAAVGLDAKESSATVIDKPEGAIAAASNVDVSRFANGKASVKVSSNVEGDVLVRVIITEVKKVVPGADIPQDVSYKQATQNVQARDTSTNALLTETDGTPIMIDAPIFWNDPYVDPLDIDILSVYWLDVYGVSHSITASVPGIVVKNGTTTAAGLKPIYDVVLVETSTAGVYTPKRTDIGGRVVIDAAYANISVDDMAAKDTYGGRTYTGATTVAFGKASAGGGALIFIIGSPSFVAGTTPYAAESPAFIENGRTFLGVRDIGTAIGAAVEWDQDTQTATISKDNVTVKVTVGSDEIAVTKGGVTTSVPTDAAAVNKDGRVYLPFRVLLEAFGYTVTWDDATQSIICTI